MPPKRGSVDALPKRNPKEQNWAIKKPDGTYLSRTDIQWQVLEDIFTNRTLFFSMPFSHDEPALSLRQVFFDQLYFECLLSSHKMTSNLRTKLIENPEFALNFCKVALLVNVGRINTTLAFYPNLKTAMRTYHPIPSLQRDETSQKDMQDAPRIKGILKGCTLSSEAGGSVPSTLREIAARGNNPDHIGPPTTVTNAIFTLYNESQTVSEKYFPADSDLYDIFYPSTVPTMNRALAFLTVLQHILEDKSFPLDLDQPYFINLEPTIVLPKNMPQAIPSHVDTDTELKFAREMRLKRFEVLKEESNTNSHSAGGDGNHEDGDYSRKTNNFRRPKQKSFARRVRDQGALVARKETIPPNYLDEKYIEKPLQNGLKNAWDRVKRDMIYNIDPDYDSDENEAFEGHELAQRLLVRLYDPETEQHLPISAVPEYAEWVRRKEAGELLFDDFDDLEVAIPTEANENDIIDEED